MPGPGAEGSQAPASRPSPRLSSLDSGLSNFNRGAAKLGKARSLLKLLQKILKTSEKGTEQTANVHSLVPCGDVVGCLAVHVKLCKDFTSKFNIQYNTNLLLRISVNEVMKCTNPQTFKSQLKKSRKDIVIHFEDVKYFSVQVPRQQQDERNRIILELVGFQGTKDFPRLLGSATVHLYEVIKKGQFTETCAMRIGNMVFCTAEVEFMFCYGSFGYGYSHQLKYPEVDLRKTLKHSMFIRIPAPEDRADPQSNIITSQHRGYSAFFPPDMNVTEETLERDIPTTSGVPSDGLEILQSALNKMSPRNRLEKMKKEYQSLKTWPEKAEYLDQLIMKRGPKMTTEQNMASRFKEMVGKIQHTAEEVIRSCSATSADSELQEEQLFRIETEPREDSGVSLRITETVLKSVETDLNFAQKYAESEENLSIPTVITMSASTISQKLSAEKVPENLTRKSSEDEGTIMDSKSIISIALERETKRENSHAKEEIEDLKPAGMLSKGSDLSGLEKYPVIQIQYQQPILSGDKFEPFLRHIGRTQSNTQNEKEDDQEVPIFTLLENKFSCVEIKEDQDPPFKASSAIAASSSDVNLSKNGQHLSILKLIESKMELEEGGINVEEEESPVLAIRTDLPEKWQEERLSETEIVRLNSFLSNTLEDFLIDRLINIIMLKSVLSKNLEVFIAEKLSELGIVTEVELGEEFQNLQRIADGSPVFLERDLLTKRKDTFKKMLSEAEIINLKSVLSKNLQDRLIERFSETGIITNSELGKQHQYLSLQDNKDRSPLVLMTDLAEKMHESCEQRLSEMEISLKSVVTQNVQDLPIASPLETRLTKEKKLLKEHQNFSLSSTEKRQPTSDADLSKKRNDKSREKCSEPAIIIKYLSQNLQNNGTKRHSQTAINTKMELEKEHQNHSLQITEVRLPMTMETNSPIIGQDHHKQGVSQQQINLTSASDKTFQDSLIERLLETEIMSLKDFLNKCLHDHLLEKLSETGLIMKEELETVHQNYSLMNILERQPGALETELHNVSQVNSDKNLAKPHIIKGEPILSGPIQDFLLEVLSETEIKNLKSFLSKKIQDHLVERLSEIGLITEEELRKIHKDLFVLRANERLSRDVESDLPEEEQNISLKSVLTKNLKDRLSETKLLQLKSVLSKILKEGHRDKLSETEIKSLKSILSNNMQDLPMECISETGLINERELEGVCQNLFLQNAKGKPLIVTDTDIFQKGHFHSKQSPDKSTVINEKPILRKEKLELPVENVPEQVTCVVSNLISEAQTNSVIHLPQNNTLERESQDPQSCFDKTEVAHSQTYVDKSLKAKSPNENLKGTLETTGSPSLNAHDIAIQTELKEYLCKPTLSFPVNPQTFIFVHSGSEEETKSPDKSHEKSKGKKKHAKRSKKHAASRYPPQGQVLMCTQFKKEKQIGLNNCKEILKEKQRKHSEPPSSRSCVSGAKKDSKHSTHSESLTQKAEQQREDGRPKKSLNKSVKIPTGTVSELQLQHSAKALQEKSYNYADKKELDVEMFRHLEKAVERALCDLGKVPEVSMSQPLLSAARPHTAPIICSPAKETHRVQPASSYTPSLDSSDTDDPGNATNSECDILESQAQQVEKASEKWAEFCKIVQRILDQNLKPQKDG